jgi:hypothetical protein
MTIKKKLKIFKVFYDVELEKLKLNNEYEFIYAIQTPYNIKSITNYASSNENNMEYIEKSVKECIENNINIDGVFIKYDIEAIITTAILEMYQLNVKIPTFESIFLLHHKYYGRTKEINPIKFTYIDIFDDNWEKNIFSYPFYLKPTDLQISIHQYVINNKKEMEMVLEILRIELPKLDKEYKYIYHKYLDINKYPLAIKHIVVIEEIIKNSSQINWEGYVNSKGNIYTFSFTDEIFADKDKYIFSDFVMKSKQSKENLKIIEKICFNYLKNTKFKNGFTNIELWISNNNNIRIIECNPRCAYPYYYQYLISYNIDLYNSVINISMGKKLKYIPNDNNFIMYSTSTVLSTKFNGKVNTLIKIEEVNKLDRKKYIISQLIDDFNFEIVNNIQNNGRIIMRLHYGEDTYDEIIKNSYNLKKNILVKDTYYK